MIVNVLSLYIEMKPMYIILMMLFSFAFLLSALILNRIIKIKKIFLPKKLSNKKQIEERILPHIYKYTLSDFNSGEDLEKIKSIYLNFCKTNNNKKMFISIVLQMAECFKGEAAFKFKKIYQCLGLGDEIPKKLKSKNKTIVLDALHEISVFNLKMHSDLVEHLLYSTQNQIQFEALNLLFKLNTEQALTGLYSYKGILKKRQQEQLLVTLKNSLIKVKPDVSLLLDSENQSLNEFAVKLLKVYPQLKFELEPKEKKQKNDGQFEILIPSLRKEHFIS